MVGVEQWAEIRRMRFVKGLPQREIHRRTGLHRDTIRRAIESDVAPVYRRDTTGSKLDAFKPEIHRLLKDDPKLPGVRVRELLEPLGCAAGKTVVDDYLREVRPLFASPPRTFQRTVYRPGELCQFDVWQPRAEVPVGHGQTRPGWVVVARLGYSRAGAGVLIFSEQTEDLLAGIAGCTERLGALPAELVWDRQVGIHGHGGRPSEVFAAFCEQLKVAWRFCEPADPQAKGAVERLRGYAKTNFEPGRVFANELDFQGQLDGWFAKVNARTHKTLRARPVDRLAQEHEVMRPLPEQMPDTAKRLVTRVPPDPHLRLDTNDYSLDPGLVGRRVEVILGQREVAAIAVDTGEIACRHTRSFAKHRTITALEHARALRDGPASAETPVEVRPLARYDALTHERPDDRAGASVPGVQGAGGREGIAQALRPGPRGGVDLRAFGRDVVEDRDRLAGEPRRPIPHQGREVPRAQDARGVRLRVPDIACKPRHRPAPRPAGLPRGQGERRPARTARHRQDAHLAISFRHQGLPRRPARRSSRPPPNGSRCSPTLNARAASTQSSTGLQRIPLLIVDEVGYIPFDPQRREPDVHARLAPLLTRVDDRHQQQAVQRLGRDLRRRSHRRRHDRPLSPPRRTSSPSKATATGSKTETSTDEPPPTETRAVSAVPAHPTGSPPRRPPRRPKGGQFSSGANPAEVAHFSNRRNWHGFQPALTPA